MNVTHPVSEKILERLASRKGEPVPVRDLLDLGSRVAVAQSLTRLVKQGPIRRIRRGLYEYPRIGKLLGGPMAPSAHKMIQAWARQNGLRVVPSGAYAANLLGLSTQVPAKLTYYTNGRTRVLALGPYSVKLLNRGPKTMDVRGRIAPLVFQALRHLGQQRVTQRTIAHLRSKLPRQDRAELRRNLRYAAAWMKPVIENIAGEEGG